MHRGRRYSSTFAVPSPPVQRTIRGSSLHPSSSTWHLPSLSPYFLGYLFSVPGSVVAALSSRFSSYSWGSSDATQVRPILYRYRIPVRTRRCRYRCRNAGGRCVVHAAHYCVGKWLHFCTGLLSASGVLAMLDLASSVSGQVGLDLVVYLVCFILLYYTLPSFS
jgi:hypothetical protein